MFTFLHYSFSSSTSYIFSLSHVLILNSPHILHTLHLRSLYYSLSGDIQPNPRPSFSLSAVSTFALFFI